MNYYELWTDSENIIAFLITLGLLLTVVLPIWIVIKRDVRYSAMVRINHLPKSWIIETLGLTDRQAGQIVARRHASGYFVNYKDFVARTDCFSRKEYKKIKRKLDFTISYTSTRINHANCTGIMEGLWLTADQAGQLVAQRDKSGYFTDYRDFVTQTGLPKKQCAKIKEYLDFTIHYTSTQICFADRKQLKEGLHLSDDQARKIVDERDTYGDFSDYNDFVRRTGIPETQCATFRKYLSFTINHTSAQINRAGRGQMQTGLRLTNDQARKIIDERDARGDFSDYGDFLTRTGFSEKECAGFKEWLRFEQTYTSVQINFATEKQIKAALRLTDSQAQTMVAERDAHGEFSGYDDFIRRTGFSEKECARFKKWMKFKVSTKINFATYAEMCAELGLTASEAKIIVAERKTHVNFLDYNDFRKKTRFSGSTYLRIKKYLDFTIRPPEIQPVVNDSAEINLDEIIRKAKTGTAKRTDAGTAGKAQAVAPARLPAIKINDASETEIQERLGVTIIQAKMIVAERKARGNYPDYGDFVNRTGLSERVCSGFRDSLDFTVSHFSGRKQGRVLDI